MKDLGHAYDGQITPDEIVQLMSSTTFNKQQFWEHYLADKFCWRTFRNWYSGKTKVDPFLLVYLTATFPELYSLYSQLKEKANDATVKQQTEKDKDQSK